mgnify:CR=1 FL=1
MSQIHSRYADSKGSQNANLLLTNLYLLLAASGKPNNSYDRASLILNLAQSRREQSLETTIPSPRQLMQVLLHQREKAKPETKWAVAAGTRSL